MLLKIFKNRTVSSSGTWGTKNENNYEILNFEFPEELEEYNKRIVYYLGNQKVWDAIIDNKAILTNAITTKGSVKAYIWCTKSDEAFETDVDFRTQIFVMNFFENDNADGIVPTEEQVDGFNTMLTAMNNKIDEVDALEQTIGAAEAERQEAEATRVSNENTRESNESTRQTNEQTRQTQEADRERRTDEAISNIQDKTAEYNANAEEKTNEFNQNATQKTNEFNSNYTQKVNDFNTNATTQKTDFNTNASSKTSAFNSNAETKTNTFNTNATNKTNAFNSNATEKTTTFDDNASSKTTTFNENATSKTNDFNDNATEKTTAYNENAQDKIDEYDEHIVEYQAQIDELQEEVEELSENMPWNETEQATEISVTDAAKYSKNKLELFGNTSQDSTTGKNLANLSIINQVPSTTNGELVTFGGGVCTELIEIDNTKDIVFSFSQTEGRQKYVMFYGENQNYLGYSLGMQTNWLLSNNTNYSSSKYVRIRFDSKATTNWCQLEYNSTATDYEPYTGGQPSPSPDYPQSIHVVTGNNTISIGNTDYPINLGSLELCKIGDYQDYLYKENGNWYTSKRINKYKLTSGFIDYGAIRKNVYRILTYQNSKTITPALNEKNTILTACTHFVSLTRNQSDAGNLNGIALLNTSGFMINLTKDSDLSSVSAFKTFVDNNDVIIYYILATPIITQITDETLISQLDAIYEHLQLVKGTNNITVTAEDLAPYMELSYMQDLKSKLDNLDSRLSLLE